MAALDVEGNPPELEMKKGGTSDGASSTSDDSSSSEGDSSGGFQNAVVYVSFLLVGGGCGWFVADALFQLLANHPVTQRGGKMYGTFSIISGWSSLGLSALYLLYLVASPYRLSVAAQQRFVFVLILVSLSTLVSLVFFWDVGAPEYPFIIAANAFGCIIANSTLFFLFPLIAAHYGGWLVAPVRAGTDLSTFVTTLLAEAQDPTGNQILFPDWILFGTYAAISMVALAAWVVIVRNGIGLIPARDDETKERVNMVCTSGDISADSEEDAAEGRPRASSWQVKVAQSRQHLSGTKQLLWPIFFAITSQVTQWGILISFGEIAAKMTDPVSCHGTVGQTVYRTGLTLNRGLLPFASVLSSCGWCPLWLFNLLGVVQATASFTICSIVLTGARDFWTSALGQVVFVVIYGIAGALEGFLITMAYRYIGDGKGLTTRQRQNFSSVLSFLCVVIVNPVGIFVGQLVTAGSIGCVDP